MRSLMHLVAVALAAAVGTAVLAANAWSAAAGLASVPVAWWSTAQIAQSAIALACGLGAAGCLWHLASAGLALTVLLQDALAAAGLPHVRLHSARHTTATLLLEAGVPLRTAQEILGQTQALTTARYQHPSLSLQAAALAQATSALTLSTSPLARPEPGPV